MSLFDEAMKEMQSDIVDDLEQRIWERLESRIEQALNARHMSVAETAKYLHVGEHTIRRMISSKELPHFRVRNQIFFRQTDVDQWVAEQVKSSTEGSDARVSGHR